MSDHFIVFGGETVYDIRKSNLEVTMTLSIMVY